MPQVRLVDEENNQVGIVDTTDALRQARDAGMDLVEVAPNERPPVCRIMDYGKWKYRQKKKEQQARKQHHTQQLKEVRLRPKTDTHDLDYKVKNARQFLEDGDRVQFTMLFRGREMAHRDLGRNQMLQIAEDLNELAKIEVEPKMSGRRMTMVLIPHKKGGGGKDKQKSSSGDGKEQPAPQGSEASPPAGEPSQG
jgi:translation initiation factor IF-3